MKLISRILGSEKHVRCSFCGVERLHLRGVREACRRDTDAREGNVTRTVKAHCRRA